MKFLILIVTAAFAGDVSTVPSVDLKSYLGAWNEIQRVPNKFQYDFEEGDLSRCLNTVAKYTESGEGRIRVENTCTRFKPAGTGEAETAVGRASIVEGSSGSKLKVNFIPIGVLRWLGLGNGDYWVLGLGPVNAQGVYSWALVGEPTRKYGWILARSEKLPPAELEKILKLAESNGYRREQFISARKP